VAPDLFNKMKQEKMVAVHEALDMIGLRWVGLNNQPLRAVVGTLFDAAQGFYKKNDWRSPLNPSPVVLMEVNDLEFTGSNGRIVIKNQSYTNSHGEWEFPILPRENFDSNDQQSQSIIFPIAVATKINSNLETLGMDIIRRAVDQDIVDILRGRASSTMNITALEETTATLLTHTKGAGLAGDTIYQRKMSKTTQQCGSYYSDLKDSVYLTRLEKSIIDSLLKHDGQRTNAQATSQAGERKYILLKYSTGGENWAHTDDMKNEVFPYQALLMLSNSDEYDGGEFYVANRTDEGDHNMSITRLSTPKLNAGDLVIFKANSGYYHGMKRVTRGERVAVGLLQSVPEKKGAKVKNGPRVKKGA
jgi:hypothetical protein